MKANAYGHGLELASGAIADDIDWFGVDSVDEALELSEAAKRHPERSSLRKPTLIMGFSSPEAAVAIVRHEFRQIVYRFDAAEVLSKEAVRQNKPVRLHIKVETGTNRQGVRGNDIVDFATAVSVLPGVELEGLSTHFANIEDTLDPIFAKRQLSEFNDAITRLGSAGIRPREIHAAATAGIVLYPETHFTLVRLGIGAYGVWPSRETRLAARERGRTLVLRPALTWKTRIAQLKRIESGEFVGYGLSFQAGHPMTLAIVPTGYSEGYDRKLSNTGVALVGGKLARVAGRVAMNMTVLDVTDLEGVAEDDEVVLLGEQEGKQLSADEVADKIGTISYEVLSRINPRIKRRRVGPEESPTIRPREVTRIPYPFSGSDL